MAETLVGDVMVAVPAVIRLGAGMISIERHGDDSCRAEIRSLFPNNRRDATTRRSLRQSIEPTLTTCGAAKIFAELAMRDCGSVVR